MKKSFILLGIGALLLSSCAGNDKKLAEDSVRIAELQADYTEAASFNDSLMLLMGDIYTGLDSINMQEGLLYNMGSGESVDVVRRFVRISPTLRHVSPPTRLFSKTWRQSLKPVVRTTACFQRQSLS